jgi:4-amino-4-deoxy-L-arabinose transferase-like glycosyltransferase
VSPYFDHVPFYGLVVGGWSLLFGGYSFETISLKVIRIIPFICSVTTSILLFFLAKRLYGYRTALYAFLVYSTVTLFVMNGRVVLAENLLTTFLVGGIYVYIRHRHVFRSSIAALLSIVSFLSFQTKELGIAVSIIFSSLLLIDKVHFKYAMPILFSGIVSIALFFLYGAYFGWEQFLKVFHVQGFREIGPQTLLYITSTPIIVNKIYYDGWYFLGFFALAFSLIDFSKNKYIIVPSFVYLCTLLIFLTQKGEMGWYNIPLFPFMSIAIARYVVESMEKYYWISLIMLLCVGNYCIQHIFEHHFGITPSQYRILLGMLLGPFCLIGFKQNTCLQKRTVTAYFYGFLIFTTYLTYSYVHPS